MAEEKRKPKKTEKERGILPTLKQYGYGALENVSSIPGLPAELATLIYNGLSYADGSPQKTTDELPWAPWGTETFNRMGEDVFGEYEDPNPDALEQRSARALGQWTGPGTVALARIARAPQMTEAMIGGAGAAGQIAAEEMDLNGMLGGLLGAGIGAYGVARGHPQPKAVQNAANVVIPQSGRVHVAGQALTEAPVDAWHGSPYNFSKFDTKQIGKGEGAQAYGQGLYFAERQGTARSYKPRDLGGAPSKKALSFNGFLVDAPNGQTAMVSAGLNNTEIATLTEISKHPSLVGKSSDELLKSNLLSDSQKAVIKKHKAALDAGLKPDVDDANPNRPTLYKVRLHVEPDELIHYDIPWEHQPEAVRRAFIAEGIDGAKDKNWLRKIHDGKFVRNLRAKHGIKGIRYSDGGSRGSSIIDVDHSKLKNLTAADMAALKLAQVQGMHGFNKKYVLQRLRALEKSPDPKIAAQAKTAADHIESGAFRYDDSHTFNYVIFNEDEIEILEKQARLRMMLQAMGYA